jgi:hypothetical protein
MKKYFVSGLGVIAVAVLVVVVISKSNIERSNGEGQNGASGGIDSGSQTESAENAANVQQQVAPVEFSSQQKQVAWSPEELSEAVQMLLGLDGKEHNYPELMQAIAALGYDLSPADVAALRDMLTFPNDRFPDKMRPIEINSIKNDVLDRLLRQTELSEGLGLQMAEMAGDASNDPVWRDYSIQFMGQFYERFTTESGGQMSEVGGQKSDTRGQGSEVGSQKNAEATVIQEAMMSALDERSETLAGTSLIGLELLSRTHEEFDRELIVEKTVEIAADESASSSCRLTALRLASLTSTEQDGEGLSSIAETTRLLAQTGETFLLRSAAIVTLGEVGTADDRELLESFTFSENKQIAAAAQLALKKMDVRE